MRSGGVFLTRTLRTAQWSRRERTLSACSVRALWSRLQDAVDAVLKELTLRDLLREGYLFKDDDLPHLVLRADLHRIKSSADSQLLGLFILLCVDSVLYHMQCLHHSKQLLQRVDLRSSRIAAKTPYPVPRLGLYCLKLESRFLRDLRVYPDRRLKLPLLL